MVKKKIPVISLDSTVPVPKEYPQAKYPFGSMEVGDSFVVPNELRQRVAGAASQYTRRSDYKIKFTTRSMGDGTVRIWRTK